MDEREFYEVYCRLDTHSRNFWDWEHYRGSPRIVSRLPLGVVLLPGEGSTVDLYVKGEGSRRPRLVRAGCSTSAEDIQGLIQTSPEFRAHLERSILSFDAEIRSDESVIRIKRDRMVRWVTLLESFFQMEVGE